MTKNNAFLTLILSFITMNAFANPVEVPIVDAPQPDQVIQSVTFTGAPNRIAMASIIDPQDGTDLVLWITHQKPNDIRYYSVVDNSKLGLAHGGMAGTESTLSVSKTGALEINQQNESVGRDRWTRTLTVSYRRGQYVVSGYTYTFRDTLNPNAGGSCDYNLLTGKGQRNGRPVRIKSVVLPLQKVRDSEKFYSCEGW